MKPAERPETGGSGRREVRERVQAWAETIKFLENLGAKSNHKCLSC